MTAAIKVYETGKSGAVGEFALPEVFALKRVNTGLLYDAVEAVRTNRRQGTSSTKTRGQVRGGGKKPYRQKGTGQARAGSIRSPIWVGGGQAFGPKPRPWHHAMPKGQRRHALVHSLAVKHQAAQLVIVKEWQCEVAKTKPFTQQLAQLGLTKGLIVTEQLQPALVKSARNVPHVDVIEARALSAADVMAHEMIVFTQKAFEQITARCCS